MKNAFSLINLVLIQWLLDQVIDRKRFLTILTELESFKKQYRCDWFLISAKTNENVFTSVKKFVNNIYKKFSKDINRKNNDEEVFEIPNLHVLIIIL